ncbi:hypothetical protein PoB_003146100 [Plakobranchus ocellatus]|uniref:TNF family profile domain-containing protein n=1 Tax=Plakobranchus ocellatus TaxID=259542 RepID=A0AAV4A9I7_9GAST|nr:hypothetical protein PoB_003146100 [Plakobranchus ocellatus]
MKETKIVLKQGVLNSQCPLNPDQIEQGQSAGSKHSSHMETDPRWKKSQNPLMMKLLIIILIVITLAFAILVMASQKTDLEAVLRKAAIIEVESTEIIQTLISCIVWVERCDKPNYSHPVANATPNLAHFARLVSPALRASGPIFSLIYTKTDTPVAAPVGHFLAEFQQSLPQKNQSLDPSDEAAAVSTSPSYPYLKADRVAHLLLNVKETIRKKSNVWWTEPVSGYICFVGSGLRYNDGRLQVLQASEFYAYSEISFSALDNTIPHNLTSIFVYASMQRSYIDSSGNNIVLPPNVQKLTLKKGQEKSLRFSEAIRMEKSEWIGMYISHPSLLKGVPNGNSFGLLRVGTTNKTF